MSKAAFHIGASSFYVDELADADADAIDIHTPVPLNSFAANMRSRRGEDIPECNACHQFFVRTDMEGDRCLICALRVEDRVKDKGLDWDSLQGVDFTGKKRRPYNKRPKPSRQQRMDLARSHARKP